MDRRMYPVVTSTILAIALTAIVVRVARPYLPEDPPNRLLGETEEFLKQGSRQQVDWRTMSREAMEEARRHERPILLLVGAAWSELGRLADREVFRDTDVEAFIGRHFLPIRVDAQTNPNWSNAILPLNPATGVRDKGFQVYVLDPDGRVVGDVGELGFGPPLNAVELVAKLQGILDQWSRYKDNLPDADPPGELQSQQEDALLEPPSLDGGIDYQLQSKRTVEYISRRAGLGFNQSGASQIRPSALRYLLWTGRHDAFRAAAAPYISGDLADWMDGGFYEQVQYGGRRNISFDKRARPNALMMEVFAEAACLLKEPIYAIAAEKTFDWLTGQMAPQGYVRTAIRGDEAPNGRSVRASFAVSELRNLLLPADLAFARDAMGLRVESNPLMTVRVTNTKDVLENRAQFERIVALLKKGKPPVRPIDGPYACDIHAYVSARLTRTAMLLGDRARAKIADRMWQSTMDFLAGTDLRREIGSTRPSQPIVWDYLAFSDACLQRRLSVGDKVAGELGEKILRRAAFLFQEKAGVWLPGGVAPSSFGLRIRAVPEVLDNGSESSTAMAIRLSWAFATMRTLIDDTEGALPLMDLALAARNQFADDEERLAFFGSAFFNASMQIDRQLIGFVGNGPSVAEVESLARLAPYAIVFGVDMPSSDGYFVGLPGQLEGPFSLEAARDALLRR